jgi:hypothetical protein
MLDLYCERCGPGLLAEPLNAITNASFLIAAWAAWRLARRLGLHDLGVNTLIGLAIAVGIGSALFHTFATEWASILDLVPIFTFQLVFLGLYLRRSAGWSPVGTSFAVAAYLTVSLITKRLPPFLNGSILYAPTFLTLVLLAIAHHHAQRPGRNLLLLATAVFAVALFFRSIDEAVCPYLPIGTHFLWHTFNGGLLYLAMKTLILERASLQS